AKHVKKMNQAPVRLSESAAQSLVQHQWPGNVRELDNAIQRALILQQGGVIQAQDLCLHSPIGQSVQSVAPRLAVVPSVTAPTAQPVEPAGAADSGALGEDLRRREFQVIIDTLRAERGRRKEA